MYSILVGTALLNGTRFECFLRESPQTCESTQFVLGTVLVVYSAGEFAAGSVVFVAWLNMQGRRQRSEALPSPHTAGGGMLRLDMPSTTARAQPERVPRFASPPRRAMHRV